MLAATTLSRVQTQDILEKGYAYWRTIPGWVAPYVAALTGAGYLKGLDGDFNAGRPITRIQAGFLVSEILKSAGYGKPAGLKNFRDAAAVPNWVGSGLVKGVLRGSENLLRPNRLPGPKPRFYRCEWYGISAINTGQPSGGGENPVEYSHRRVDNPCPAYKGQRGCYCAADQALIQTHSWTIGNQAVFYGRPSGQVVLFLPSGLR
jgi:hypothetical protein